jgi:hypothetical protein
MMRAMGFRRPMPTRARSGTTAGELLRLGWRPGNRGVWLVVLKQVGQLALLWHGDDDLDPRTIAEFHGVTNSQSPDVAPDGSFVVVSAIERNGSDIGMIELPR